MDEIAELELNLRRFDALSYVVDLRFSLPASDSDVRPERGSQLTAQFDFAALLGLAADPEAYGQLLTQSLFAARDVLALYEASRGVAASRGLPLCLRLGIDVGSPELHALRWELLRDPQSGVPLSMSETIRFTRYLSSSDWRQARVRSKEALRALVLIAHPTDLEQYGLQSFDWDAERARLMLALGSLPVTLLLPGQATLANFERELRRAPDLVVLVAHGAVRDEPLLWLEDAAGASAPAPAAQLELLLRTVEQPPRLMLLSACQSAGGEYDDLLAALAPRLAGAGVPAIVGMRGTISVETAGAFQQTLVEELLRDGQIDRAVAAARRAVRQRPDAWMPVLFSRLKSGRLWYVPRFGDDGQGFQRWPTLKSRILSQKCTPILGPGLFEPILGSTREIARQWAESYSFPLQPHDREDLPRVAQYLAVNQDAEFVRDKLGEHLRAELLRRFGDSLPEELRVAQPGMLDQMLAAVSGIIHQRSTSDAHTILARLPFPLYITTNADSLLESALGAHGKAPHATLCPWNDDVRRSLDEYDDQPTAEMWSRPPSPRRRCCFWAFGSTTGTSGCCFRS